MRLPNRPPMCHAKMMFVIGLVSEPCRRRFTNMLASAGLSLWGLSGHRRP
jgi:hypothetical protein